MLKGPKSWNRMIDPPCRDTHSPNRERGGGGGLPVLRGRHTPEIVRTNPEVAVRPPLGGE